MAGEVLIAGDLGVLSVYITDAYKPIGCLTSSSLSSTLDMLEKVNMCNPGVTVRSPGNITQSVSIEGEIVDTTSVGGSSVSQSWDELLTLQVGKVKQNFKLDRGGLGAKYFEGYISELSDNFTAGEDATFSATLTVEGQVSDTDPKT